MSVCSIWPFAQISDDFYDLSIWWCARYFVAALFKELALITIREMWGLESRSRSRTSRSRFRLLWQSLGLASKFEPGLGLGLGGYGLDYITVKMCGAVLRIRGYLQWLSSPILSEVVVDDSFLRQNFGGRRT